MSDITLYDFELDENCYKVRLLLAALDLPHRKVAVDVVPGGEEKQPALLALNPNGALPILVDDGAAFYGAEAILLYLAHRYDDRRAYLPADPLGFGAVSVWLQFAAVELGAAVTARHQSLFAPEPGDVTAAKRALRIMDDHMTEREFDGHTWFVGDSATLADIALFPGIALSRDYGVDHEAYPALRRWMRLVRRLPGFITMPGIPNYY